MASLNRAEVIGYVGREPELRRTQGGTAVAGFSLATDESYTDQQGRRHEQVEWHRVTAWGKLAENVAQYVHKGQQVYVEGKLASEKWQGRDGVERETTRIVARQVLFLGKRGEQGQAQPAQQQEAAGQLDEYDLGDMSDPFAGEDPGLGG
jgi:single-strand DNA-binding protein